MFLSDIAAVGTASPGTETLQIPEDLHPHTIFVREHLSEPEEVTAA